MFCKHYLVECKLAQSAEKYHQTFLRSLSLKQKQKLADSKTYFDLKICFYLPVSSFSKIPFTPVS
jgi:hypothetical protein